MNYSNKFDNGLDPTAVPRLVDDAARKLRGQDLRLERTDIPAGCVCDPEPWAGITYNDICDRFVADASDDQTCVLCWHEHRCHAA